VIRLLAIVLFVVTSLLPIPSLAQPVQSPPRLVLETVGGDTTLAATAEPGDTIRDQVRFGADRAMTASLRIANLTSPPNGGIVPVTSGALTAPATWLRLETGDVELAPESATTRSIEVAVPATAAPGQYLAGVIIETSPSPAPQGQLPKPQAPPSSLRSLWPANRTPPSSSTIPCSNSARSARPWSFPSPTPAMSPWHRLAN
jgi:hypothetical protein